MESMHTRRRPRPAMAVVAGLVLAASTLALSHPAAGATRPTGPLVPATGALFGAYVDPDGHWTDNATQFAEVTSFESLIGRGLDIVQHYYAFTNTFPSGLEQWDIAGGRIPLVSWAGTSLDAINAGSYDSVIRARADGMKALGVPVFLRWCWEMNGNWSSCDGTHNNTPGTTDGPAKFVAAWRRIHDIFAAQGATNVVWVWSVNAQDVPSDSWNHSTNYYPGDAYVDWVGIDGYNWGTTRTWSSWTPFASVFADAYATYASRKPIMISETASAEQGGDKAQWIADARSAIESRFPSIAALVWFDVNKEADWRADSSPGSLASFRDVVASAYLHGPGTTTSPPDPVAAPAIVDRVSVSPRPLARRTRISFRLHGRSAVTVRVHKPTGTVVRTLRNRVMRTGRHQVYWWGANDWFRRVGPGRYVISVRARSHVRHRYVTRLIRVLLR